MLTEAYSVKSLRSPCCTVTTFSLQRCVQDVKFKSFETSDLKGSFKILCDILKEMSNHDSSTHVQWLGLLYLFNLLLHCSNYPKYHVKADVTGTCLVQLKTNGSRWFAP